MIERIYSIRLEDLSALTKCVKAFIREANEDEATPTYTLKRIEELSENENGAVWFAKYDEKICGYFLVSVQDDVYGKQVCFVEQLYFSDKIRRTQHVRLMDKLIVEWAKKKGLKRIMFCTKRNAEAFRRLLTTKFEINSTVLMAEI